MAVAPAVVVVTVPASLKVVFMGVTTAADVVTWADVAEVMGAARFRVVTDATRLNPNRGEPEAAGAKGAAAGR